jgi:tetratricopeptide (TPR) repeat protein
LQVARLFNEAAVISPEDADVHIVLGVLYNLSREYDKAIAAFERALKLKPHDYSLWNKLGATQANSVQSADAISAYQQVCTNFFLLCFPFMSFMRLYMLRLNFLSVQHCLFSVCNLFFRDGILFFLST